MPKEKRFLSQVVHRLHRRSTALELWELQSCLGQFAAQVQAVYAEHNGFVLYQDCRSTAAAIEALPIRQWTRASQDLRSWLSDFVGDLDEDRILGGVPFAHVPESGNYFVMPIDGPSAGRVFYADHDGWYESAFATDFDDFIRRVTTNPVKLIAQDLGCCTRYSDGSTKAQWIPNELADDLSGTV